jgi:sugar lactone lactonase YvrE
MNAKPAQRAPFSLRTRLLAIAAAVLLAACGGEDSVPPPPPPAVGSATLDAAGGMVNGPDGVQLVVPPEALSAPVTIRIARNVPGAPALPAEAGQAHTYEITPHDLAFALPVQVRLPLAVQAGANPVVMSAAPGGTWAAVPATFSGGVASIERPTLSYFFGWGCAVQSGNTDPYPCARDSVVVSELVTAPAGGYDVIPWPGNVVVRAFTAPVTATYRLAFTAPRDCSNGELSVRRIEMPIGAPLRPAQAVLDRQPVTLVPSGNTSVSSGTFDFVAQVGAAQNGTLIFGFDFTCTRAYQGQRRFATSYDSRLVRIAPPPAAPTITQQPANAAVTAGSTARFTVLATGAATLAYTWERSNDNGSSWQALGSGTALAGGSSLSLTAALADDRAQFRARVCSVAGAQQTCIASNPALLSVTPAAVAPSFSTQPADITVVAGQTASFSAVAVGIPAPQVRWQVAAAGSNAFADVAGEPACVATPAPGSGTQTASTCTIAQTAVGTSGSRYRALAVNAAAPTGTPSAAATLTVNPAPVAPTITTQPAPQSTTVNGSATFTVVATGTAPLNHSWRINGIVLATGPFTVGGCAGSATPSGSSLTLSNLSAGCNGAAITVVVSNGVDPSATSNPATLTVTTPTLSLALLAGNIGGPGAIDGTGSDARVQFHPDSGIAVDAAGTAYFSDPIANRLRKVTAAGVVTTFGAALLSPQGAAVDSAGNVYVAERAAHRIVRFAPDGTMSVWVGSTPGDVDGTGTAAQLINPDRLTIDANDNLYFTQATGNLKIRRVSPTRQVTTFYDFGSPTDGLRVIAAAPDGSVYGAGAGAWFGTVQRVTAAGVVTLVAGAAGETGDTDGAGAAARFLGISGLAFGGDGNLYAVDGNLAVRRITPAGVVSRVSGQPSGPFDGAAGTGRYEFAQTIAAAANGDLLIGDYSTMRRLTPSFDLSTFVGQRLSRGAADGTGSAALFQSPEGVALDDAGNAYVADFLGSLRRVTPAGVVTTLSATRASHIVRDVGTGFVVASSNAVWRMTAAGALALLAGNPLQFDYVDAPVGTDARFGGIRGLAVDAAGNVFVAETVNQNATIRRITPAGEVTTWAGAKDAPPEIVDGDRLSARFSSLSGGLAFDAGGNLVMADFSYLTGTALLRRITPQGTVYTFVNGGALRPALSLALAPDGSLLAGGDATLQRISAGGAVTTLVGTQSQRGVKLGAAPNLNLVYGLAVRPNGQVVLTSEAAVLELTLP